MNIPVLLIGYVEERPKPALPEAEEAELRAAPRWGRNVDHSLYNAKRCASCGEVKLKTLFHRSSRKRDGRYTNCIECHRKNQKKLTFEEAP